MFDLQTIQHLNDEFARQSAQDNRKPYAPFSAEEIEAYPPIPFPVIGSHKPIGWHQIDAWLCDKTGRGDANANEPALTAQQLIAKLLAHVNDHYGYAITEQGQFQLHIGVFLQESGG